MKLKIHLSLSNISVGNKFGTKLFIKQLNIRISARSANFLNYFFFKEIICIIIFCIINKPNLNSFFFSQATDH